VADRIGLGALFSILRFCIGGWGLYNIARVPLLRRMADGGGFGRKTGEGFFTDSG